LAYPVCLFFRGPEEEEEAMGYEEMLLGSSKDRDEERGRGGDKEDASPSYFDWTSDDVFIPRLPDKDALGRPTTDQIVPGDNFEIKVSGFGAAPSYPFVCPPYFCLMMMILMMAAG